MKLKKLFAGVVAAAMIATMSFPAFAADPVALEANKGVEVANGEHFTIEKSYTNLNNIGVLDGDTINLKQADNSTIEISNNTMDEAAKTAAQNKLKLTFNAVTWESSNAKFDIELPDYTAVGKYVYTVDEVQGNTAGVTYNTGKYTITVIVVNANPENVSAGEYKCYVSLRALGSDTKVAGITNSYNSGTVTVEKKVTGSMGEKDRPFHFTVTFAADDDVVVKSTMKVAGQYTSLNAGDGATVATDAKTGTTTIKFANNGGTATVTVDLTHGQSINFINVPYGVKYTVSETGTEGYTAKINESEVGQTGAGATISNIKVENATNNVLFTNNNGAQVDTGVILDNAPYMLMLAVVAGGAMMLVIKKRREEE